MARAAGVAHHAPVALLHEANHFESTPMDMLNMSWNVAVAHGKAATPPHPWLRRWPAALVAVTLLALFASYLVLVRDITHNGELRRVATAAHSNETWRCQTMPGRTSREACLRELNAPAGGTSLLVSVP